MLRLLLTPLLCLWPFTVYSQVQPYEVTDSFGKHYFESIPQRVIVTDWSILDNLIELGVIPVGAPELANYQTQVKYPLLPSGIIDIGLRQAPTLAAMKALNPDLIIIGTGQKSLARPFSHIAKVVYYKNFSERYRHIGEKSQERYQQLAQLFHKEDFAKQNLLNMERHLNDLNQQLQLQYGKPLPSVAIVSAVNNKDWILFGENSLPGYAIAQLGLKNSINIGFQMEQKITTKALEKMEFDYLVILNHPNNVDAGKVLSAIPKPKIKHIETGWPYGGALSIKRIAAVLTSELLVQNADLD